MESNPGDGKACKLKAFVALPEALLMPEKISVTVTDLRRTTNISLFPDRGIKRQHSFEFHGSSMIVQSMTQCVMEFL